MYAFVCPDCGRTFEELLPMSRSDSAKCPSCGQAAKRAMGREGFACKKAGSGGCSGECGHCAGCPGHAS